VPTTLTGPYELFCPQTPVGDIALNDAVTSGTVTPSSVTAGSTFNVTGYQTVVNLPASIVTAAAALGNSSIAGTATAQVDATGATPATTSVGPLDISVPIPSPVPDAGVSLSLPSAPQSVGPFTATTAAITIQEDSAASLTLDVSGSMLSLTCNAYPNNSVATGITTSTPPGSPIAPVIAIANGGSQATTTVPPVTTTTKAPATGAGGGNGGNTTLATTPVTAPSTALAFTGPGPGVGMLGVVGGVLVLLGFALLALVDAPRRAMARMVVLGPETVRRLRRGEFADRLAILNPMRKKQAGATGLPDMAGNQPAAGVPQPDMSVEQPGMTVSQAASADTGWIPGPVTSDGPGRGERLSRLPVAGRDIAQNTVRRAMRAGQWLLGR